MPGPTIVCVSANPAMDRRLRMQSLAVGEINRAHSAQGLAGGKAAHVAMATLALGVKPVWVGFLGGAIGQECARQMETLGIRVVAIPAVAATRVNLEIIDAKGRVTEILEPGAEPTPQEREEFTARAGSSARSATRRRALACDSRRRAGARRVSAAVRARIARRVEKGSCGDFGQLACGHWIRFLCFADCGGANCRRKSFCGYKW